MKRVFVISAVCLLVFSATVKAQKVRGEITDEKGRPIAGVRVLNPSTKESYTKKGGLFKLKASIGDSVYFMHPEFERVKIYVEKELVNVQMRRKEPSQHEWGDPSEWKENLEKPGMPKPPSSLNDFLLGLGAKVRYPRESKKKKKQGKVIVGFVVDSDGSIIDVELVKGLRGGGYINEEAMRVFSDSPNWTPAQKDNKNQKAKVICPIIFQLR